MRAMPLSMGRRLVRVPNCQQRHGMGFSTASALKPCVSASSWRHRQLGLTGNCCLNSYSCYGAPSRRATGSPGIGMRRVARPVTAVKARATQCGQCTSHGSTVQVDRRRAPLRAEATRGMRLRTVII